MRNVIGLALGVVAACATQPPAAEPTGPATIVVTRDDGPVAGATVVFHDQVGAVVMTTVTDAAGRAASGVAVAAVTVVDPATPTSLVTITHLVPSAEPIVIPLEASTAQPPAIGMLVVQAPAGSSPAGTDHYVIETACGSQMVSAFPATIAVSAQCLGRSGGVPVVVEAWTPMFSFESPGQPLAYVAGVAGSNATGFTFTPGSWSTACRQVDVTTQIQMEVQLFSRLDGVDLGADAAFCSIDTGATDHYSYPLVVLDEGATGFSFGYVDGNALRTASKTTSYAMTPTAIAIEHDPDLLIGDIDLDAMDGTGARWSATSPVIGADVIVADLQWAIAPPTYIHWRMILPASASAVELPALPASVAGWSLGSATERLLELQFIDTTWLDALGDVQHVLPTVLDPARSGPRLPGDASVRVYREQFYPDATGG